jgi:hypothetical protein
VFNSPRVAIMIGCMKFKVLPYHKLIFQVVHLLSLGVIALISSSFYMHFHPTISYFSLNKFIMVIFPCFSVVN